ncbi:MAG: hypothetical protein HKP61_20700 [Dactylosporangium sp.]|nr:hypothetical protein [Dactylosporangium sp.]NNJ63303.1 hypothetical protein [Dactylosporangium sp.]
MPSLKPRRSRPHRHRAPLTIIGLLGLATVVSLLTGPASAEVPPSPCLAPFTASSAADLVTLRRADLAPLGAQFAKPSTPFLGSTRAGLFAGANPQTAARAGLATPGAYVYQLAPPSSPNPVARVLGSTDSTHLRTAAQGVQAAASLTDVLACDGATGPQATASLELRGDSSLRGHSVSVLQVRGGASTAASTRLTQQAARYSAVATAAASLTDLQLFGEITVRVDRQPALRVTASGITATSGVGYEPPTLAVATPSRPGQFQTITDHLDLIAPVDTAGFTAAAALADAEQTPLLPISAFGELLAAIGAPTDLAGAPGRVAVVRISPGRISQQNLGWRVHAVASAIRIQLLLRSPVPGDADDEIELAELAIGGVEALASAPSGGYARPGSTSAPEPAAPHASDGAGPSGTSLVPAARVVEAFESATEVATDDINNPDGADADPMEQTRSQAVWNGGQGGGDKATEASSLTAPNRSNRFALVLVAGLALLLASRLTGVVVSRQGWLRSTAPRRKHRHQRSRPTP